MSIGEEHYVNLRGERYIRYSGLLEIAHQIGLRSIETELIQVPSEENGNVAIFKARTELESGQVFVSHGDASPQNVGRAIVPHVIRQAETRSKARSLKDATNVGAPIHGDVSEEEEHNPYPKAVPDPGSQAQGSPPNADMRGAAKQARANPGGSRARKSQIDLLKTLAEELRGEEGVARLEARIGKPLEELTSEQANEWIEKLNPEGQPVDRGGAADA